MKLEIGGLQVEKCLADFVSEVGPGVGVSPDGFWRGVEELVNTLGARNEALLKKRDGLQQLIDSYHLSRKGERLDPLDYHAYLRQIGYLVPEGPAYAVETANVDPELAQLAGPQLVCPSDNARFLLNACNARWGSLLDAFYGTDVIPETPAGLEKGQGYNPKRGAKVFEHAEALLDEFVGLQAGRFSQVTRYSVEDGQLRLTLADGTTTGLRHPAMFVGYQLKGAALSSVLLRHNNLHLDVQLDPASRIGRTHRADMKDVVLEAALTTIVDLEDSVAVVDAEDKVKAYRNWHGLMAGTLSATFSKDGKQLVRRMEPDRAYTTPAGGQLVLKGRATLLVRNVGIHMYTSAVTAKGKPVPEGFLDAMFTALSAMYDLKHLGAFRNSATGSMYIVKPKQHGPEEVAFTCELFGRVEKALGLAPRTLKVGIMDEERRTTVNLLECIRAAKDRVVFINTGFLDRTGDEIHTSMEAGPMLPKDDIRTQPWIRAYEDWNVDVGLLTGLPGHGQIGKGMWAVPDNMKEMLEKKVAHPAAGANTAWVPSPTAATVHAIHYHRVCVQHRQAALAHRARASLADILTPPLLQRTLRAEEVQKELDNNAQGILGYVVRWVEQGIGCSKIPDIHNVGLMEDRATLRINSQHIANWLHWGLVTQAQVLDTFKRIAKLVDQQNRGDPKYRNMAPNYDTSTAFQAALALVLEGRHQPNGYTEFVLTKFRQAAKANSKAKL